MVFLSLPRKSLIKLPILDPHKPPWAYSIRMIRRSSKSCIVSLWRALDGVFLPLRFSLIQLFVLFKTHFQFEADLFAQIARSSSALPFLRLYPILTFQRVSKHSQECCRF